MQYHHAIKPGHASNSQHADNQGAPGGKVRAEAALRKEKNCKPGELEQTSVPCSKQAES